MTDLALPQGKGRRPQEEQYQTRRKILSATTSDQVLTTPEISDKIGVDVAEVRRAMAFFVKNNVFVCLGSARVKGKQGHPPKKWKRIR